MTGYYADEGVTVWHDPDGLFEVLRGMPDASIDAVVTDPPYGLEFMGKEWDGADGFRRALNPADVGRDNAFGRTSRTSPEFRAGPLFQRWCDLWAIECLRVLKPGGHMLAFGGTRTFHRLACAVEDAGFEIRDSIAWLYGSGFPKSLDVSKAIDKAAGAERDVLGAGRWAGRESATDLGIINDDSWQGGAARTETAPATPDAERWQGWGTALKPAFEPIVVARKPLAGTVAANVLAHGTGALNVDGCRVGTPEDKRAAGTKTYTPQGMAGGDPSRRVLQDAPHDGLGRWPANVILDESQAAELDKQSGETSERPRILQRNGERQMDGWSLAAESQGVVHGGSGGASRFFYVAKADQSERVDGIAHPTVKPLTLMRWLVRLVTPPGGTVLESFAGSGTTVEACILEDFQCIAIEREADYLPLIVQRINRRRDPVAAVKATGDDGGLFDLLGEETA